jgi:hypothetical protein
MPDDSFKEFVLDQLGALPELRARERVKKVLDKIRKSALISP